MKVLSDFFKETVLKMEQWKFFPPLHLRICNITLYNNKQYNILMPKS